MGIKHIEAIANQYEVAITALGSPLLSALIQAQDTAAKAAEKARKLYDQYTKTTNKKEDKQ